MSTTRLADPRRAPPRDSTKRTVLVIATLAVIGIAVAVAQRQRAPANGIPEAAEIIPPSVVESNSPVSVQCLHDMVEAARQGDVARYRACFTGDLLRRLESRLSATNAPTDPGRLLQGAVTDLKGVATTHVEFVPPDRAAVTMELIYADHDARQQVSLRKVNGAWKIADWTDPHRLHPDIVYGTSVDR
jgi:hypothetical protein